MNYLKQNWVIMFLLILFIGISYAILSDPTTYPEWCSGVNEVKVYGRGVNCWSNDIHGFIK